LMYFGDTRLQALVMMATMRDSRLVRKALWDGQMSRWPDGMMSSNFAPGGQMIPTFGIAWLAMLKDYIWWRGDDGVLREFLPGGRAVIDWWLSRRGADGLVVSPVEWSFVDWAGWEKTEGLKQSEVAWHSGMPPGGMPGEVSYVLNWLVVWGLGILRDLEMAAGEEWRAAGYEEEGRQLAARLEAVGWDAKRGLYRDAPGWPEEYSEHAQVLAILSGRIARERAGALAKRLAGGEALTRATVYFSHYLLEAFYRTECWEGFDGRLEEWRAMPGRGFKTPYEVTWDVTRSDCHGWGSHPLFHVCASMLGVRPDAPGFARVRIAPLLGVGRWAKGVVPHPLGEIVVDVHHEAPAVWHGRVEIPEGVEGRLILPGCAPVIFRGAWQLESGAGGD